jgi:methylation protein EvaC
MSVNLCRISGKPLKKIIDFGMQPLGNGFIEEENFKNEYFFSMEVGFCETSKMFQLINQPEPERMFHDHYAFFSSTSNFMEKHFKDFSNKIIQSEYLADDNPFVVELGCNDGIMLKNFADSQIRHLGIEPSLNVAKEANKKGVRTCSEFFSEKLADKILAEEGLADAFIAANVMCHIPNILDVVKGIKKILKPSGVVMFEDPYLGDVISKTSYDQIYDEHVFLFSAHSIQYLFGLFDLELIDLEHQDTHGGSMRYILAHRGAYSPKESVKKIIDAEINQGLNSLATFENFKKNVEKSKIELLSLLKELKANGKKVFGYAATSKSTTILNYCNIGQDLIECIVDTTPMKQNKFSPGMHIPIVPYQNFTDTPPDYAFLLAWNHFEEIMAKEKDYSANGGKWLTHVPQVKLIN